MKLSEMTNAQAAEAMIRLSGPFAEICDDEDAVKIVDEYKVRYNKPRFYLLGQLLPQLVSHVLVKHRAALYEIISVLTEQPVGKIDQMNFGETVQILRDSYDDMLASFFTSSGGARKTAGKG